MKELVILSGKGGTGKTSLTASFAALANKCLLCDADVDAADLKLLQLAGLSQRAFGGIPAYSIHGGVPRSVSSAGIQRALEKRMVRLGKKVMDCDTRVVWLKEKVRPAYGVTEKAFSTWRPGEEIPCGETHSDSD